MSNSRCAPIPVKIVGLVLLSGIFFGDSLRAEDAFPSELVDFVPASKTAIFTSQGKGHWDVAIRERGWILKTGDVYRMWYTGYDGSRSGLKMLGYATSTDGLKWTRHPKNPIYKQHWVEDMMVVHRNGTYYMFAEGANDQAQLLTSKDGVQWKRQRKLDIRTKNGKPIEPGPYGTPTAWFEDGTWYLFYERRDAGIWLATSKDMTTWTHLQDDPVIRPGPGKYDRDLVAMNQIVKYRGRYYAYYHGAARGMSPTLWTTNIATSTDLVHWTKYSKNPLMPLSENKSSGIVVHDGKQFRLYTMHNQVHVHLPRQK